jgi:SNF2 family DNA or RNA helicase
MDALAFIKERDAVLLHCGMGTGKSRIAIECCTSKQVQAKRVLVLCPLSVVSAWEEQFSRFAPHFDGVFLKKGSVMQKATAAKRGVALSAQNSKPVVVVINYESARNDPFASWAMAQRFDVLIMDESHKLKSHKGATSKWVRKMSKTVGKKLALTGTPMPHDHLDIWAQFMCLEPAIFGSSFYAFRQKFSKFGGWGGKQVVGQKNVPDLRQRMAQITFQASRDVLELPEAIHEHRSVELSPKCLKLYEQMERDFCVQLDEGSISASNALVKLLRLAQLTSGSVTVEADGELRVQRVDTSKEEAMIDLLDALPADEPVVIFGRFTGDLVSGHNAARRTGRKSLELSGKKKELEQWQRGDAPILCVQIQAGGVGVDLTRAAYCLFASSGYSLGDHLQALARCHRPGQERTVFYYHLLCKDTVDEKVYRALRARKNVVDAVLADIQKTKPRRKIK